MSYSCLVFFVPLENFSLIWSRHHCRWRAANFDPCSELMAIELWGFFSVSYLLWHGESVYNGQLRGSMTLTPNAERLAVELLLPVLTTFYVFLSKFCKNYRKKNLTMGVCRKNLGRPFLHTCSDYDGSFQALLLHIDFNHSIVMICGL